MKQSVTSHKLRLFWVNGQSHFLIAFLGLEYVFQPISVSLGDRKSSLTKTDVLKYFL